MPVVNEVVSTPREQVEVLTEDVPLRHEPNAVNVRNNRGFCFIKEGNQLNIVEVVRRGLKTTRIRRNLAANAVTELVATDLLVGYTHPSLRGEE